MGQSTFSLFPYENFHKTRVPFLSESYFFPSSYTWAYRIINKFQSHYFPEISSKKFINGFNVFGSAKQ